MCRGVYFLSFAVCFVLFFKRERKKDRKLGGQGCEEGELRETHDQNTLHEKNGFQFLKKKLRKRSHLTKHKVILELQATPLKYFLFSNACFKLLFACLLLYVLWIWR